MAVPEDWIGKRVSFAMEGASRRVEGELTDVNDRGIVLAYSMTEGPPRILFYPWRMVRLIEIAVSEQQAEEPAE